MGFLFGAGGAGAGAAEGAASTAATSAAADAAVESTVADAAADKAVTSELSSPSSLKATSGSGASSKGSLDAYKQAKSLVPGRGPGAQQTQSSYQPQPLSQVNSNQPQYQDLMEYLRRNQG